MAATISRFCWSVRPAYHWTVMLGMVLPPGGLLAVDAPDHSRSREAGGGHQLGAPARGAGGGPATDTLRAFFAGASRVVTAPDPTRGLEERRNTVRALAERVFDFRGAAATALGPAWEARTPAGRAGVARLFTALVESGYLTLGGAKA